VIEPIQARGLRYIDFFVPGLIGMLLMNTTLLGVGVSLVEMRVRHMLRRFAVTPMRRSQLLLAQISSRLLFTWVMAAFLFAVGRACFGVEVKGSFLDVALLLLLGGFSFSGIALALAARTESIETAQGLATIVALPMMLFSGVFFSNAGYPFSTTGMPGWIRAPASLLPLTVLNDSLRAVTNEGEPVGTRAVLLLAAWGGAPFAYALTFFRWT
jgi:ABC-type multidrug transport system permease subunit